MSSVSVPKLYRSVIEDVINGVRDLFLDDGVDEQVLIDLKQTWYKKVEETKALIDDNKDKGASTTGASSNLNSTTYSTTTTITPATRPVTTYQPQVTQVIASNQPRHITTGSSTHTSITQVITTNPSRTLNAGGSSSYSQQAQINQVISSNPPRTLTSIGTTLPQQTQITPVIATNQARHITSGGSGLPQQLSFPPGSVIPHTVLQFPSGDRIDGSKSVPGKVIFLNTQASGLMSSPATTASLALPPELASSLLQQAAPVNSGNVINIQPVQPQELVVRHTNNPTSVINGPTTIQFQPSAADQRSTRPSHPNTSGTTTNVVQLDGPNDNSSDEDDDDDEFRDNEDDHEDDDNDQNDDENEYTGEEEVSVEPLNSEDDVSDEDPHELFDTDNVVVCQYDKITRSRNKWKFHLKDGIMNLQGKDYVFQKAIGDAEW